MLTLQEGTLVLVVEDDGRGFEPVASRGARQRGEGLGLVGTEERAALLGGSLTIESAPGQGTTMAVEIPLGQSETHDAARPRAAG